MSKNVQSLKIGLTCTGTEANVISSCIWWKKTPSTWATTLTWKPCLHNHICQLSILNNHIFFTHTFQSSLLSLFLEPFVFLPSDLSVKKLILLIFQLSLKFFLKDSPVLNTKKCSLKICCSRIQKYLQNSHYEARPRVPVPIENLLLITLNDW